METSDLSIPLCNSMLLMVGSEDVVNMKRTEMGICSRYPFYPKNGPRAQKIGL